MKRALIRSMKISIHRRNLLDGKKKMLRFFQIIALLSLQRNKFFTFSCPGGSRFILGTCSRESRPRTSVSIYKGPALSYESSPPTR